MFRNSQTLIYALILFVFIGCNDNKQSVDSIIIANRIYTSNTTFEIAESMAITNGGIIAIGTKEEITAKYKSNSVKTFEGFLYPGFIDAHSHFHGYGITLNKVDLRNTFSMQEVVDKVVAFGKEYPENWITGRGWDQTDWTVKSNPNNVMLNAFFPNRPVLIRRIDGHAGIANAKALELAGITTNTKVIGGTIEVVGGRLTGLLTDNALDLVKKVIPPPSLAANISALKKAEKNCLDAGLTTVTDAGLDLETILLIDSLQKLGELKIRVYAMANPSKENFDYFTENGRISTPLLQVSAFKLYADGALGSRGAKLKAPYCDDEDNTGVWVTNPQIIDSMCDVLNTINFQVATHCIGDSANRKVLEIYSKYLNKDDDKRWRIEHAQVVTPADRPLYQNSNIIPSVQPTHATSDMPWVQDRLCANRVDGAYAYKSLLGLNGWLPLGTDFPVEEIYPLHTFYSAVYRQNTDQKPLGGFLPKEALSPKEAIHGMTIWAAKANFMEHNIGSLETGKYADFVVLDTDILYEKYMLKTEVLETYIAGNKVN